MILLRNRIVANLETKRAFSPSLNYILIRSRLWTSNCKCGFLALPIRNVHVTGCALLYFKTLGLRAHVNLAWERYWKSTMGNLILAYHLYSTCWLWPASCRRGASVVILPSPMLVVLPLVIPLFRQSRFWLSFFICFLHWYSLLRFKHPSFAPFL